ncbi:methyltransferase domain-containing protein [Kitasatospora sp. GP82]|uniref:methyltransferase domain-containing protein n=1 Tax=Kitasatospora sp. GP82 TaxID=3035089 RepID=UPI0024765623|nr:methyltransferase domain-containing protein [Kitasatospora sp. GP82]MDH6126346.1 SAM-dependent methyltransferase [Kitasatospora sp. GP82]
MKFGLYATDTYTTCQGHPGSLGHEAADANDFVAWGVDCVKYDDCPYGPQIIGPDGHNYYTQGEGEELTESVYARVQTFQKALDAASAAQGRPKVTVGVSAQPVHTGVPYLLGADDPARTDPVIKAAGTPAFQAPGYAPTGVWCGQVANPCRMGGDRDSELSGVLYNGQLQTSLRYPANVRPGSWNDMDMMFAGWQDPYGLWGTTDTCTCHKPFTDTESRTEMSILSMMAAPLISGADFRNAPDSVHGDGSVTWSTGLPVSGLAVYENRDVVAVDQDSLAKPATLVGGAPGSSTAPVVLKRQLVGGDTVVLLVNQDPDNARTVGTSLGALGLTGPGYSAKELWTGTTGRITGDISASVAPHGVAMYRLTPLPATVPAAIVGDGMHHTLGAGGTGGQVLEVSGTCSSPSASVVDINTSGAWAPAPGRNGRGPNRLLRRPARASTGSGHEVHRPCTGFSCECFIGSEWSLYSAEVSMSQADDGQQRPGGDPGAPDTYSTGVLSHERPTELKRLRALERMSDAWTQRVFAERGLRADWRCLELGAGAGSIARWLSAQCPDGKVVALDIDTRFLDTRGPDAGRARNLDVVQCDLRDVAFPPASFDLVHARALMMHLPHPEEIIAKVARWLAPGGWLVLEDPVNFATDSSPHPAWRRIMRALEDTLSAQGSDLTWARRRQPAILAEAGLVELGLAVQPMLVGDGGAVDDFMRLFFEQAGPELIERNRVTSEQLAEGLALLDDPRFLDIAHCYLIAWGRRPSA